MQIPGRIKIVKSLLLRVSSKSSPGRLTARSQAESHRRIPETLRSRRFSPGSTPAGGESAVLTFDGLVSFWDAVRFRFMRYSRADRVPQALGRVDVCKRVNHRNAMAAGAPRPSYSIIIIIFRAWQKGYWVSTCILAPAVRRPFAGP